MRSDGQWSLGVINHNMEVGMPAMSEMAQQRLSRSRYTSLLERPRRVLPLRDNEISWRSCRRWARARLGTHVVLPLLFDISKRRRKAREQCLVDQCRGLAGFEDVRLHEITEAIIDKCWSAEYYEEAPSAHSCLPPRIGRGKRRRGKHHPNKYKKMRGRRNKRARTDRGAQDTVDVEEEYGHVVGSDDGEPESSTVPKAHQPSASNSSEEADDDNAASGPCKANLDRPLVIRCRRQASNGNEDGAPSGSDVVEMACSRSATGRRTWS